MNPNIEQLKELISKVMIYDQQLIEDINKCINKISIEIEELHNEIDEVDEENFIDTDRLIEIDCGIGTIEYLEPDNLRLQLLMQEFKERQESVLQK